VRLGDFAYQLQYLQLPVARGGNRFKREWFGTYRTLPLEFDVVCTAWDTAFKESETSDYSACVTIGFLSGRGRNGEMPGLYVLHAWHGRVAFSELKQRAMQFAREWRPNVVVIEDAASGQSLLQELKLDSALPLHPQKVQGDKLVRAAAVEPTISSGRVLLPDGAVWVDEFLREVCAFPSGAHDDYVDARVVGKRSAPLWQTITTEMPSIISRVSSLPQLHLLAAFRFYPDVLTSFSVGRLSEIRWNTIAKDQ